MIFLIPIFLVLIYWEWKTSTIRGLKVYVTAESLSHILTGIGQVVVNLFYFALTYVPYKFVYENYALLKIDGPLFIQFTTAFIAVDFLWYWSHRASHRINIFVASHTTHHQAEDYNFLSSLRQSWTSRIMIFVFFFPLAFFGIKAEVVVMTQLLSQLIQFLTHIGIHHRSLGKLDKIFISPAAHFAHHGINRPYLDKNYGGVFSIWDRWFGTYVDLDEKNPPRIGVIGKFNHLDPVEANVNYYRRIGYVMVHSPTIWEKVSIVFRTPETLGRSLKKLGYVEKTRYREIEFSKSALRKFTLLILLLVSSAATTMILWKESSWMLRILTSSVSIFGVYFTGVMVFRPEALKAKSIPGGPFVAPESEPLL